MKHRPIKVSDPLLPKGLSRSLSKLIKSATEVQNTSLLEVRSAGDLGKGVFAVHDIARGTRIISEAPLLVVKPSLVLGTLEEHVAGFCAAVQTLSAEDLKTLDNLYCNPILPNDTTQHLIHEWLEQHGDKQGRKLNTRNLRRNTRHTITRFLIFVTNGIRINSSKNDDDEIDGNESNSDESDEDERDDDGLFALYSRVNHSCSPNVVESYNSTIKRLTVHATRDIKAGDQVFTD